MSGFVNQERNLCLSNPGQRAILQAVTSQGAFLRTTVRGTSMTPFIRDGDVLTIAPMDGYSPHVGDVVAFIKPGTDRMAIHRLIASESDGWLVRGDNCTEPDGVIVRKDMIGYVTRIEHRGRDVKLGIGPWAGWIAALNRGIGLVRLRRFAGLPRRAVSFALRLLQSTPVYRRLARRFAKAFSFSVADESEMEQVLHKLNPAGPYQSYEKHLHIVNWVAKCGTTIAGFVQFVYHPASQGPWTGYWLFSLHVWGRFRGMGIGGELTRRVIGEAEARGAQELLLAVNQTNRRAIKLYRNMGFDRISIPALEPIFEKEQKDKRQRRVVMCKKIGNKT